MWDQKGLWFDEPFVGISLVEGASIVTWRPPGSGRFETWVERGGRLLTRHYSEDKDKARKCHAETLARVQSRYAEENLRAIEWLRAGIKAGYLTPSPEGLRLTALIQGVWDLLGQDYLSLANPFDNGLAAIEVGSLAEDGVCFEQAGEEPLDQGGREAGCGSGSGAIGLATQTGGEGNPGE